MDCPSCFQFFNNVSNVPILLSKCGHSICKNCVQSKFSNGKIECPKCNRANYAEHITDFPKNVCLLEVSEAKRVQKLKPVQVNEHEYRNELFDLCSNPETQNPVNSTQNFHNDLKFSHNRSRID